MRCSKWVPKKTNSVNCINCEVRRNVFRGERELGGIDREWLTIPNVPLGFERAKGCSEPERASCEWWERGHRRGC